MHIRFVTTHDDQFALARVPFGYPVTVLQRGESAAPTDIAIFTISPAAGILRKQCLFMAPHRFGVRGIAVPAWALSTPFQVAIHPGAYARVRSNFVEALRQMAETYEAWNPHVPPPAPWNPLWHMGSVPAEFTTWQEEARQVISPPPLETTLRRHLTPVFEPSELPSTPRLLVMGCAAFNAPHTDVTDALLEHKMLAVVNELAKLAHGNVFYKVQVVLAPGSLIHYDWFRRHLHSFIFASIDEVEAQLHTHLFGTTRLFGRFHARSLEEIAESFDASASALVRQLADPLRARLSVPVETVSWLDILEPYIPAAQVLVEQHEALLRDLYAERVRIRSKRDSSYAKVHAMDPATGFDRTVGNAVLYLAEAMYLRDHPDCVVANCEPLDIDWKGLQPLLSKLWSERVPFVGMIGEAYRQPWGYGS